jgi:hypothetical protein
MNFSDDKNMKSKNILIAFQEFLETKEALLLGLILSLVTQLWHSVTAFVELERSGPEILKYLFGVAFAFSNSFAILMFTLRGSKIALFFLTVEIFINIMHYKIMDIRDDPSLLISTVFMSIIVPVTISQYSKAARKVKEEIQDAKETAEKEVPEAPPKLSVKVPVKPSVIDTFDREALLKQINDRVGFDITNKTETSENLSQEKVKALRSIWRKRNTLSKKDILDQIDGILKESEPLFA